MFNTKQIAYSKIAFIFSLILCVSTLALQIYVTNEYATKGEEMSDLLTKKTELEKEVSKLSLEKSSKITMSALEVKAKSLGFVDMTVALETIKPAPVASLTSF